MVSEVGLNMVVRNKCPHSEKMPPDWYKVEEFSLRMFCMNLSRKSLISVINLMASDLKASNEKIADMRQKTCSKTSFDADLPMNQFISSDCEQTATTKSSSTEDNLPDENSPDSCQEVFDDRSISGDDLVPEK